MLNMNAEQRRVRVIPKMEFRRIAFEAAET